MITGAMANVTVSDIERAQNWYVKVLGREADVSPMQGLLEWHLTDDSGLQVWTEPDRAGRSTVVVRESDLDGVAARLTEVGVAHDGPQSGGGQRILPLSDPDGNRVVFAGE